MKAIRFDRYGPPEVLQLRDVDMPVVGGNDVLVRVRAASVNPLDWHFMRGSPYLVRMVAGLSRPRACLLYTSPSPRDRTRSRMPSSA